MNIRTLVIKEIVKNLAILLLYKRERDCVFKPGDIKDEKRDIAISNRLIE